MINKIFNKTWQFIVRRLARARGFIDPIALMTRINQFAKPSEVSFPIEVVRIGIILQARGVVNSQAIQHNLDWVWPFWVVRQFDPRSISFIPRAFSMTHINLTHRNWTAVGLPHRDELPIVDPRGLVTPTYDGWSIDGWVIGGEKDLLPSQNEQVEQQWILNGNLSVETKSYNDQHQMIQTVELLEIDDVAVCAITYVVRSNVASQFAVSIRPFNPEGVSFVNEIAVMKSKCGWVVDKEYNVYFDQDAQGTFMSKYHDGDVYYKIKEGKEEARTACDVGMSSAAKIFSLKPDQERRIQVFIPVNKNKKITSFDRGEAEKTMWRECLASSSQLNITHQNFQYLYDAAIRTMIIHSAEDVYPGPYTYKHFWFRDAAFMHYAMLCVGLTERCARLNKLFLDRQQINGYFRSQEGEWDSNGQVLWALRNYYEMTNQAPPKKWKNKIEKAIHWIKKKRLPQDNGRIHDGLMPSGFSAEHFGPNDFYYWDDFWSVAGLQAGDYFMRHYDDEEKANEFSDQADSLMGSIKDSLQLSTKDGPERIMPSSPYRRLDSSSIGSVVVGYPLQMWKADDLWLMNTVEYLLEHCFIDNGFFHDMSHSGINPYLTLYVAQILLRAGDARFYPIMQRVADLASATGQWPEAIHPTTLGGCMGDGQHAWAAAEWLIMIRHCFVREEEDRLIVAQGVQPDWYAGDTARFEAAPTKWGTVDVCIEQTEKGVKVTCDGRWHKDRPAIDVRLPRYASQTLSANQNYIILNKE